MDGDRADAELVRQCLAGNEPAWREFVSRFQQPVFGLCLRMLGHRHDAEDVAQEALVRAIRALGNWDGERPLLPWLLAIAANRCKTFARRRGRRPDQREMIVDPVDVSRHAPHESHELQEELEKALADLREEYRLCFILFYQNDLGCADIARVMNCPVGTVKTWLHRARHEVAKRLLQRGVTGELRHELRGI